MKNLNCRGFSSLTLTVILPVILSLLAGSAFIGRNLIEWNRLRHLCQVKTLKHQNELRTYLVKLLALNPRARSLRTQEQIARIALAAASATGHPAAISTATYNLRQVQLRQLALEAQQQIIINLAKASAHKFNWNFRTQFSYQNKRLMKSSQNYSYPLAVEPVPPQGKAPQYLPVQNFEKRQKLGLSFSWRLTGWNFMMKFFNPNDLNADPPLVISCGSTLKQENNKWYTHLSAAKL